MNQPYTYAPLEDRLDVLAEMFREKVREEASIEELKEYLGDHACSLVEFARQVREEYVRVAGGRELEEVPTTAQGVALARFLRGHFRHTDPLMRLAHVTRGGAGLPGDYLHVRFLDGYEGGIDPRGNTST